MHVCKAKSAGLWGVHLIKCSRKRLKGSVQQELRYFKPYLKIDFKIIVRSLVNSVSLSKIVFDYGNLLSIFLDELLWLGRYWNVLLRQSFHFILSPVRGCPATRGGSWQARLASGKGPVGKMSVSCLNMCKCKLSVSCPFGELSLNYILSVSCHCLWVV